MQWCSSTIVSFLTGHTSNVVFIPYAGVGISYIDYTEKVNIALSEWGLSVNNLDDYEDKKAAIQNASAILVGGGNTFHLLRELQRFQLTVCMNEIISFGTPYVGRSAGSNIASPTICTTNDMPIVQPKSFKALHLVPFQINPHYTEDVIPNHGGESREQRLQEFLSINPDQKIVALPEASYLIKVNDTCKYVGHKDGVLFTLDRKDRIRNHTDVIFE